LAWPMAIKGAIKRKFHKTAVAASPLNKKLLCIHQRKNVFKIIKWFVFPV